MSYKFTEIKYTGKVGNTNFQETSSMPTLHKGPDRYLDSRNFLQ